VLARVSTAWRGFPEMPTCTYCGRKLICLSSNKVLVLTMWTPHEIF